MDFSFSEEQQEIQKLAAQILGDKVTHERLKEIEASPEWFDRDLWAELGKAGLVGIALPEDVGGGGFGILEASLVLEEIGRTVAPVPYFATVILGALPIAEFGNDEQRKRLLPGVVEGDTILTAALTEDLNADPTSPTTTAKDGRLTGTKMMVPAGRLPGRRPTGGRRLHRHRGRPPHGLAGGMAPRRGPPGGRRTGGGQVLGC